MSTQTPPLGRLPQLQKFQNPGGHPFMMGFIDSLTRSISNLRQQNQQQAARESAEREKFGLALLQTQDAEMMALGLTILNPNAKKTDILGRLKKDPAYEQARSLTERITAAAARGGGSQEMLSALAPLLGGGMAGGEGAQGGPSKAQGAAGGADEAGGAASPLAALLGAPGGAGAPGAGISGAPPAAQAPPTISQEGSAPGGWAAAAGMAGADPSQAGAPPTAGAAPSPDLSALLGGMAGGDPSAGAGPGAPPMGAAGGMGAPGALGAGAPPAAPVPKPPISTEDIWKQTFQIMDQDAYRLDPQAQKVKSMLRVYRAAGAEPKVAWETILAEMAPKATQAKAMASRYGQPKWSTKTVGLNDLLPGAVDQQGQPIDPSRYPPDAEFQWNTNAPQGVFEVQSVTPKRGSTRMQVKSYQPDSGGPTYVMGLNPQTMKWEQQFTADGKPLVDSPEFRQRIQEDEFGNKTIDWVLPGGGGGGRAPTAPPAGAAAPGGSGAPPAGGAATSTRVSPEVSKVSTAFGQEGAVKRFQVVAEGYNFAKSLDTNTTSPSDDQALIYAFAKAMDPDSVVREGEYATVQKYAQSWAEKFGFDVKRIFSNSQFLTPEARANMKATIKTKFGASKKSYDNTFSEYERKLDNILGGAGRGKKHLIDYGAAFREASSGAPGAEEWIRDASGRLVMKS